MYGYGGFRPYVSVGERRAKAMKIVAKMKKNGEDVFPVNIEGRTIAKTFWGKAWCQHLESFSDFANRLPRGRTYVRNGSVIHLIIKRGEIEALVYGSSLYKIKVTVSQIAKTKWCEIQEACSKQIGSVIELLQGKLQAGVMKMICDKEKGLFPQPKEISFQCSCPDWADMCKHVAAVLYGVGARLDQEPEFLFQLRGVDYLDLISKTALKLPGKANENVTEIGSENLSALFNIEIDEGSRGKKKVMKKTSSKTAAKKSAGRAVKKPGGSLVKKASKKIASKGAKKVAKKSPSKVAKKAVGKVTKKKSSK